jgi:hypothetical protein
MKNCTIATLSLWVATILLPGIAAAQHRGTIQIQGPDITEEVRNGQGTLSQSWSQAVPLTKKEGRQKLAIIENLLTKKQKEIRRSALDAAITFINNCPDQGCTIPLTKSWPGTLGKEYRVDIQFFAGSGFTGTPPQ